MTNAIVTLAVGNSCLDMYKIASPFMSYYAKKVEADFIAITNEEIKLHSKNLEKFQIFKLFEKYDRILYLDIDILIQPNTPNLFNVVPETHIGAVYDCSKNEETSTNRRREIVESQRALGNINWTNGYINSGVMLISKQHRDIFTNPELRLKLKSAYKDQTLINYLIKKNNFPIFKLEAKYNGMEINGFSSRKINPKQKNKTENKSEAFIMHFAHEGNKIRQMQLYINLLNHQLTNPVKNIIPKRVIPPQTPIIKIMDNNVKESNPELEKRINDAKNKYGDFKLFYDISELGWSQYLAAHLKWLFRNGQPAGIITPKSKEVLYRDCSTIMLPIPDEFIKLYGGLPSDGNHLFNPNTNQRIKNQDLLSIPFKKAYPQFEIITKYNKFEKQRIFETYQHSKEAEENCRSITNNKPVILIFPRFRTSKFQARNILQGQWLKIIGDLCINFPNHKIVAMGSSDGALNINFDKYSNFINLVGFNDNITLDMLVAFCNGKIATAAIGNQSGTVKISLLCGTESYIFGHEMKRHIEDENWSKTNCRFWTCIQTPTGYRINNLNAVSKEIINFISILCKHKGILK